MLAAFAGFTLAAALSGLYLWQERRLKRREASILRVAVPPLASLDRFAFRTVVVALPVLTLGIAIGLARLHGSHRSFDAAMAVTLVTWGVYGAYVALRSARGWQGRRAAYLALLGFALVIVVRLGLPHMGGGL